jgi:hypothetical protein
MNTIIDLNNSDNRTFNQQNSYNIDFGTNAGNTTIETDAFDTHILAKQTALNSVSNAVRDLLIDVQFGTFPSNGSVAYVGNYANIGVLKVSPTSWRVTGIRDVDRYDEAFANIRVSDTGISNAYSYTTSVSDQFGNSRTWTTQVAVRELSILTNTGNVLYSEDIQANVTQLNISANANSSGTYVLSASALNAYGTVSNSDTTGSTVTFVGNIANLNSNITAGNIKFNPASDLDVDVVNALNFALSINSREISRIDANIEIVDVNEEYIVSDFDYWELYDNPIAVNISDLESGAVYTSNVIAVTETGSSNIHTLKLNTVASSSTFSGTSRSLLRSNNRSSLNADSLTFRANINTGFSNVDMVYQQVKTSLDSNVVNQTANVITVNGNVITGHAFNAVINTSPRFNVTESYLYDEDQWVRLTSPPNNHPIVTQNPIAANAAASAFRVSYTQVTPDPATTPGYFGYLTPGTNTWRGYWMTDNFSNTPKAQGSVELVGSKSQLNSLFGVGSGVPPGTGVMYLPPPNYTGNIVLHYNQEQIDLVTNETVVQANNVVVTLNIANTHAESSSITSTVSGTNLVPINTGSVLGNQPMIQITDVDSANIKTYNATVSVSSGRLYGDFFPGPGGFWSGDGTTTLVLNGNRSLTELNNVLGTNSSASPRWVAESIGNSQINFTVNMNVPTIAGIVTTEIANVNVPMNITQTLTGTISDGGRLGGNCLVANGFDAGPYYLLVDPGYTSLVSFVPGTSTTPILGLTTSENDGLDATTVLRANTDYFFQGADIAADRVSNGTGGAAAYSDWYMASWKEADEILRLIAGFFAGQGPWWTSTIYPDGTVRVINQDRTTSLGNIRSGTTQRRFFMCRRIYY